MDYYAHSLPGRDKTEWEPLPVHLQQVADLAERFASAFGAAAWGRIAGLWHDLGKYSEAFQRYLCNSSYSYGEDAEVAGKVDHSTAGAQHAKRVLTSLLDWRLLAYCIAGHHSGLLDSGSDATADVGGNLAHRMVKATEPISAAPCDLLVTPSLPPPPFCWCNGGEGGFQLATFGRMLFSCLVDADFLCTEGFMNSDAATARQAKPPAWDQWAVRVDELVAEKQQGSPPSAVKQRRAEVYDSCVRAAERAPGFFSLTVPTGGGKTLASFAFALRHAALHQLNRVIYALPYTSIIEQNAQVLRDALADDGGCLLEHHSNLDPKKETLWGRLASENWDAPVVVTTNVQLLESLFACRTSRCRKLHRLARSVIILDEAQALPVELLRPCLAVLAELVRNYGATIVLCTATQPAIVKRADFTIGLENVREIMADPLALFEALRRVRVTHVGELSAAALSQRIVEQPQVLCIVETRRRAAELYKLVRQSGVEAIHLSAAMCPAHRSMLVDQIKPRLASGAPCRVVSTQLIEAGVDVDFPVVYRSLAGLDAIAQAAGRCNREGRLPEPGQTFVFTPEGGVNAIPPGHLRQTAATARELIGRYDDLLSLDAVQRYFELHYWKKQDAWDKQRVMECLNDVRGLCFDYATAAQRFQMIPDEQKPVVMPWRDEGNRIVSKLLGAPHVDRTLRRQAQRYTVQIPARVFDTLVTAGEIQAFDDRPAVLHSVWRYDDELGLVTDTQMHLPADLSVI